MNELDVLQATIEVLERRYNQANQGYFAAEIELQQARNTIAKLQKELDTQKQDKTE